MSAQENVYYSPGRFSIMQPGEKYWRFQKFDRKQYSEVNDALKELTEL